MLKRMVKNMQSTKTKNGKKIHISREVYAQLETMAKKYHLTVDQLATQLVEKEIADAAHKELFTPGLKWAKGVKDNLIVARIRKTDYPKLRAWLDNHDRLDIRTKGEEGEVWIFKETLGT